MGTLVQQFFESETDDVISQVENQIFNKWLDNEASLSDLDKAFIAGKENKPCPEMKDTGCSQYSHDYEYVECAYAIGENYRKTGKFSD